MFIASRPCAMNTNDNLNYLPSAKYCLSAITSELKEYVDETS